MGLLSNFVPKGLKPKKSGHLSFHGQEGKETEEKQPEGLEKKQVHGLMKAKVGYQMLWEVK